jgi:membrane-associated protease RseP (regulator of RpoE activity)
VQTVLLFVLGIVLTIIGIAVSIGLHEVGHLIPAKKFGVKVGQYMIGFGPTLWSKRFGETEYGVKAIPLGGYISMAGMYAPAREGERARNANTGFMDTLMQDARDASADQVAEGEEHRTFYNLPVGKRIVIMLGGPVMNLLIGIVAYAILISGFGLPLATTTVSAVSECVISNTSTQKDCTAADPLAPAAQAGIKPGDHILSFAGTTVSSWDELTAVIRSSAGKTVPMVVDRGGEKITLQISPIKNTVYVYDAVGQKVKDDAGNFVTQDAGFIGIGPTTATVQQPLTAVPAYVGSNIERVVGLFAHLPQKVAELWNTVIGAQPRDPNGLIGVVGIGRLAGEITSTETASVADRAANLVSMLASLNIALFVLNLIPLLPLDGGHVAGALWEWVRRGIAKLRRKPDPGPIDLAKFIPLTMTVVAIFGLLTLLLLYADIFTPITLQ